MLLKLERKGSRSKEVAVKLVVDSLVQEQNLAKLVEPCILVEYPGRR